MRSNGRLRIVVLGLVVLGNILGAVLSLGLSDRVFEDRLAVWAEDRREAFSLLLAKTLDDMLLTATIFAHDPSLHAIVLAGREAVLAEGGGPGGARAEAMRRDLQARLKPAWDVATDRFGIRQLHYHLAPGAVSFLRVHAPDRFGDRLDDVRHILVDAMRDAQPRTGFELGRIYSGLRGVVPIFEAPGIGEGAPIGTLEVGTSFAPTLDRIAGDQYGAAVLLMGDRVDAAMFAETRRSFADLGPCRCVIEATTGPEIEAVMAQAGVALLDARGGDTTALIRVETPEGVQFAAAAWPLQDYLSDTRGLDAPGIVVVWRDIGAMLAVHEADRRLIIGAAALATVLLGGLALVAVRLGTRALESQVRAATADVETALEEAEASRVEAEAANAAKSRFLAAMSHDIRNPMNGVIGMAELLAATPLDADQTRMLSAIRASGGVLLATINEVLDISRIEAGRMALEMAPFSLEAVVERVRAVHAASAETRGIAMSVSLTGDERCRRGDGHRVEAILHNLVSNAVKFTETGTVTIAADLSRPDTVTLSVGDTGIGMTETQTAAVFAPFVQAERSTTRRFGGSGLGLAIVKGLVEAMGGTIGVQSAPGRGSRFDIQLPLAATAPIGDAPETEAPAIAEDLRVLMADDSEINRMVLGGMLRAVGVEAVEVASGEAALARIAADGPYDLLMLDIVMPGMGGEQALAAIRARETALGHPATPAVACTANAMAEHVRAYRAAGFDGHLAKPVALAELLAILRQLAGGPRGARAEAARDTGGTPVEYGTRVPATAAAD